MTAAVRLTWPVIKTRGTGLGSCGRDSPRRRGCAHPRGRCSSRFGNAGLERVAVEGIAVKRFDAQDERTARLNSRRPLCAKKRTFRDRGAMYQIDL